MKKRLVSLLLSVLMIASLAIGCAREGNDTTPDGTATEDGKDTDGAAQGGEVALTLWSIATESDAFNPAYIRAIEDFEEANPGVTINHETFENESYKTKIKSAVSANELPDLFFTWGGGFSRPFVQAERVLSLDEYITDEYKSQLPEAARKYATYDGKLYGSTYTTPISAVFYNKKMFDDNGITVPKTWDDFVAACKAFKEKDIAPIGISAKDTWVLAMTHDNLALKSAGPEKVASALTGEGQSYDDPDFLGAAQRFRELIDLGAFPEGAAGLSNDEASAMFYNGTVPMYITGSWMAGSIQTDAPNPEDFDAIPFPVVGDNAVETDFMGGATDTIMVSAGTKNPEMAAKAAFEVTRGISKYAYLDGAGIAAWEKDYEDDEVNPITKKLADYAGNATSFTIWFDTLMEAEDAGEYLTLLQGLYVGNISPEEFTKSMADQLGE